MTSWAFSYAIAIANYSPITIAAFRFATSGRGRTSASVAFSVSAPMPPMRQIGEGSSGCIFALSGYDSKQGVFTVLDVLSCFQRSYHKETVIKLQ